MLICSYLRIDRLFDIKSIRCRQANKNTVFMSKQIAMERLLSILKS